MKESIKNISFSDIETLIQSLSRAEFALLDHITIQMQADLELLKVLEKLKQELSSIASVK